MPLFQHLRWVPKYISDLTDWLKTAPLIASFAALVIVVMCILFVPCEERKIRVAGWLLQLLGVIVTGIGLRDTRRAFDDQPTTWQTIKQFFSRRPHFGPPNAQIIQITGVAAATAIGSARLRQGPGPNMSLDQRLAQLENQYVALFDEVGTLAAETRTTDSELSRSLEAERAERQTADTQARQQLRKAIAEGIPLAFVGVTSFLVGITAGTVSPEIASIFGASTCQ